MKRLLGVGMLLALVLVHGAPAEAHVKKFKASVTTNTADDGGEFVNFTITTKAKCIPNRTVNILNDLGAVIATGTNGTSASTKIGATIDPGESYATRITKKVIKKGGGHKHICKGATSPLVPSVP